MKIDSCAARYPLLSALLACEPIGYRALPGGSLQTSPRSTGLVPGAGFFVPCHRPPFQSSSGALISTRPFCPTSRKKQFERLVWQAAPTCSTPSSNASPSQSIRKDRSVWMCPDVSPLRHSDRRERDQ